MSDKKEPERALSFAKNKKSAQIKQLGIKANKLKSVNLIQH